MVKKEMRLFCCADGDEGYGTVDGKTYRCMEFHKVDLMEGGKLEKNFYPNLLSCNGVDAMFFHKENIFVIGTVNDPLCGYVLDINNNRSWDQFSFPVKYPFCGALNGKIYHFDYKRPRIDDRVRSAVWEIVTIPPRLGDISDWNIADPSNNRILVNLGDNYNLYGYCPCDGNFKLLGKNVRHWSKLVALADNVVYVYEDQELYAYDISRDMARLLQVVWEPSAALKFQVFEYDSLFYVGNNNFWFSIWSPDYQGNSDVYFIKFKVRRNGHKIICTPLAHRHHRLESTGTVFDFVLLQGEESRG